MSQAQKTPFSTNISNYVTNQTNSALFSLGQVLPCTVTEVGLDGEGNSVVTVIFEILTNFTLPPVTIPVVGSQYVRLPIKVGDIGMAISATVDITPITGLNVGIASFINPGNLSALAFLPLSSNLWTPPANPEALLLQGWDGVVIQDMLGDTVITLTPAGVLVNAQTSAIVKVGSTTLVVTSSGITINGNLQVNGTINSTGDISSGSVTLKTHTHNVVGVQGGTSTITTTVGAG